MSVWAKKWAYEQHPKRVEDGKVTEKKHPAAKAVLVALAEYPGPGERTCWPSQKTISDMTDMTDRQVRRCLADLEAQNLIRRSERRRADGTRRSDVIELRGPREAFGPHQDIQPDERSGSPSINRTRVSHQPDESSGHEPSVEPSVEHTTKVVADELPHPGQWCEMLREGLRNSDIPLTRNREQRYGREFKTLLKDGITPGELDEVIDRIVQRWDETQLTADMALRDCRNGKQTNGDAKQEKRTYKRPVAAEDQWKEGYHDHYEDYTTTTAEERRKIARQLLTEA